MGIRLWRWFPAALAAAVITWLIFEQNLEAALEQKRAFELHEVSLVDQVNLPARIQQGYRGYVVFYAEAVQCGSCVRKLVVLRGVSEAYDDIGLYAVANGRGYKNAFMEHLRENQIPGEYLIDGQGKIHQRLGLGDHPLLLFFNSEQRLIGMLPLDVDHDDLVRQVHRYLAVM